MGRLYNGDENEDEDEDEDENREKGHLTINDITHASIVLVIVLVTAPQ